MDVVSSMASSDSDPLAGLPVFPSPNTFSFVQPIDQLSGCFSFLAVCSGTPHVAETTPDSCCIRGWTSAKVHFPSTEDENSGRCSPKEDVFFIQSVTNTRLQLNFPAGGWRSSGTPTRDWIVSEPQQQVLDKHQCHRFCAHHALCQAA